MALGSTSHAWHVVWGCGPAAIATKANGSCYLNPMVVSGYNRHWEQKLWSSHHHCINSYWISIFRFIKISQKLRLGKMHGFGTMFWKNGSSLLASALTFHHVSMPGNAGNGASFGSFKYPRCWDLHWRMGRFLENLLGISLDFSSSPKEEKKPVEDWKIFDQLFWKQPFDSWVGGHFDT